MQYCDHAQLKSPAAIAWWIWLFQTVLSLWTLDYDLNRLLGSYLLEGNKTITQWLHNQLFLFIRMPTRLHVHNPWNNRDFCIEPFFSLRAHPCPINPNWVDWSEALYDSTRFARSRSALPVVNIREIMIHKPSSFLKRDNKLQSIPQRHRTTRLDSHAVDPHYPKSRSVK